MKKIDEILALPNIMDRVTQLKRGRGWRKEPCTIENMQNWFIEGHEINDKEKYPDKTIVVKAGKKVTDPRTGKIYTTDDETETQPANHLAVPIEQEIINRHVGFGVGLEPTLNFDASDVSENALVNALKYTMKKNRCKFNNKKEMRAWLAEQEVAEYWYAAPDTDDFWAKADKTEGYKLSRPAYRLKCAIWSPFRGDKLYPFFEGEDMTGFLREYQKPLTGLSTSTITCYILITDDKVYMWDADASSAGYKETVFNHGFPKMPIIYTYRPFAYCHNIKPERVRLEKTLSSYADCIDYNFFPYLLLTGEVSGTSGRLKNHVINLHGQGASATYLTWDQAPDVVKFEVETCLNNIYSMTSTPRISFDNLKGMNATSGVAFKFFFMDAHMQESNNEEDFGEFLQRRINFLVSALGAMNSSLYLPSKTLDVETSMIPYMIDNISDKVKTALEANGGKAIWSRKHSMMFVGQIDHIDEEVKEIEEEDALDAKNDIKTPIEPNIKQ